MQRMSYPLGRLIAMIAAILGWSGIAIGLIVAFAAFLDRAGSMAILTGLAVSGAGLLHVLLATVAQAVLVIAENSDRIARNTDK